MTLQELMDRCKAGVYLTVNEHRDFYETAQMYLARMDQQEMPVQVEPDVREKMIATDTIVNLYFYPDTPVGFYDVYHYCVEGALAAAAQCLVRDGLA